LRADHFHTNGSIALEVDMKCRCPACGRTTWVPEEQLDFLVRCDGCRTLLLTRTHAAAALPPDSTPVEILSLMDVALALREAPPPSASLDIAEFMTRRQAAGDRAVIPAKPPKPRTAKSRRAHGLAAWSILFAIACIAAAALIVIVARLKPATAQAAPPARPAAVASATTVPRTTKTVRETKTAVQPAQRSVPEPTGDGELFPDLPARN
jgi:hypothetical protein